MKTVLALALLATFSYAEDNPTLNRAFAACGPLDVQFDAPASTSHEMDQPEAGKSLVYIAEEFRKAPRELGNPAIRIAMDGQWIGAVRPNSYLFFSVEPGEHHLCTSWQSHLERLSRLAGFASLTAEPGKTYYFRARVTYSTSGPASATNMNLDWEQVAPDEGQFLVASYHLSNSHRNNELERTFLKRVSDAGREFEYLSTLMLHGRTSSRANPSKRSPMRITGNHSFCNLAPKER